jgi:hypothetical protein
VGAGGAGGGAEMRRSLMARRTAGLRQRLLLSNRVRPSPARARRLAPVCARERGPARGPGPSCGIRYRARLESAQAQPAQTQPAQAQPAQAQPAQAQASAALLPNLLRPGPAGARATTVQGLERATAGPGPARGRGPRAEVAARDSVGRDSEGAVPELRVGEGRARTRRTRSWSCRDSEGVVPGVGGGRAGPAS